MDLFVTDMVAFFDLDEEPKLLSVSDLSYRSPTYYNENLADKRQDPISILERNNKMNNSEMFTVVNVNTDSLAYDVDKLHDNGINNSNIPNYRIDADEMIAKKVTGQCVVVSSRLVSSPLRFLQLITFLCIFVNASRRSLFGRPQASHRALQAQKWAYTSESRRWIALERKFASDHLLDLHFGTGSWFPRRITGARRSREEGCQSREMVHDHGPDRGALLHRGYRDDRRWPGSLHRAGKTSL